MGSDARTPGSYPGSSARQNVDQYPYGPFELDELDEFPEAAPMLATCQVKLVPSNESLKSSPDTTPGPESSANV
jgi:hypothetical protein